MIRKSGHRFSLATNAKRLRGDHAQTKKIQTRNWKRMIMPNVLQRLLRLALLATVISVAIGSAAALAQSGSAGGSIGNDEKSLSGSREQPRSVETPARRSKPEADEPRRASRK